MQLRILPNGSFSFFISTEFLGKGLRPTDHSIRNSSMLLKCDGAVGQSGALTTLSEVDRHTIFNSGLVDQKDFPFPQVFNIDNLIIVCTRTKILELVNGALVSKLTVSPGDLWSAVGSGLFAYLSNGTVAVTRNPGNGVYSLNSDLPKSNAMCNFNGQIVVGNFR